MEAQGSFKISLTSCLRSYCNRILTFWYFRRESAFGQHISPDLCPSAHSLAKVDMVVRMKADAVDFTLILHKRHCAHPLVFRADAASKFLPLKRQNQKQTNKKTLKQKPFLRNWDSCKFFLWSRPGIYAEWLQSVSCADLTTSNRAPSALMGCSLTEKKS